MESGDKFHATSQRTLRLNSIFETKSVSVANVASLREIDFPRSQVVLGNALAEAVSLPIF